MLFWVIAIAMMLLAAGLLARALLRGEVGEVAPASYDLQVYRDQLAEVDRDLARGVISADDADRIRTEISRRILAADGRLKADIAEAGPTRRGDLWGIGAMVAILFAGTVALYGYIGAPGYPDMPLALRFEAADEARADLLTQAEAEARVPATGAAAVADVPEDFAALMEKLRAAVANRPDDLRGQMLLARNEASLGNFAAAHAAQARVLQLKGDSASAQDYSEYADMLISAAGGYVSKDADLALRAALAKDPAEPRARYYAGLLFLETGRPDRTFRIWSDLEETSPPDAPWMPLIQQQMPEIAQLAGQRYTPPGGVTGAPMVPGPDAAAMAAASEMSEGERAEMIRGMVARLSERLATEGGSAAEWARLIGAYGVLGETDKARQIWAEAQEVFGADADGLVQVREAAAGAGVLE